MTFSIAPLDKSHDRKSFDCGSEPLNTYLAKQAGQDIKRRIAACFIATDNESGQVAGYYTLSAADIPLTDLPESVAKKLPRYLCVPAARLGRLAVSNDYKGQGLGGALIYDAFEKAIRSELVAFAMIVDAKDDEAVSFYQHHGFISFDNTPNTLFLPLSVAEQLLSKGKGKA